MKPTSPRTYQTISKAIQFIHRYQRQQPSLDDIATHVSLSPHHFHKLFSDWAGVSPKQYLRYLTFDHARQLLSQQQSLLDSAHDCGLSGSGRLHDLFIKIQAMTPGDYKNGGAKLDIAYQFSDSPFGQVLVASTGLGVCHLSFAEQPKQALAELTGHFPNAHYHEQIDNHQTRALAIFHQDWQQLDQIKLHLAGSPFQLQVWQCLLRIPSAALVSYGTLASQIGRPKAARAVGTAIGANPVAYLIPCHRVIQQSGALGGYRWGLPRKSAIIGWECIQHHRAMPT